ncbi:MAG: hypothetical protein CMM07_12705 [Rhodopirellula sp.]|nr:hypothetical protein [Rhodopirellula sp.]
MSNTSYPVGRNSGRLPSLFGSLGLVLMWGWVMSPALNGQDFRGMAVRDGEGENTAVSAEARRLVEALGADSYATRLQARDKLQRMGLEAIDELRRATTNLDSEIALAAKSIVGSYSIVWFTEDDPEVVREVLEGYGAESIPERQARILMLAEMPERIGLPALVRIARFEGSTGLSRKATIEIMEQAIDPDPAKGRANAALIKKGLGLAVRQATEWLGVYADDLAGGRYSADKWRRLVRKQRDVVDSLSSDEITRASVLSLVRICAVRAASMGNEEEALRLATENMDLVPAATNDLIEASNWATDHQLYPFVFGLYAKNRPMFDRSAVLLYGYAYALQEAGEEQKASRISDQAFSLSPLAKSDGAIEAMQPRALEELAKLRREIAENLRKRGMFEWAAREYRQIVDALPITDLNSLACRIPLSEMYGELEQHQDVIDLIAPVIDRMAKDAEFRARVNADFNTGARVQGWPARLEYHSALRDLELLELAKKVNGEAEREVSLEKARKRLMAGYLANTRDIDILIKMYGIEGDAEWRNAIKIQLDRAKSNGLLEVKRWEARVSQGRADLQTEKSFAQALNNYAWLVCNTEGDLKQALKYSLRSVQILEDSARLDTCGRCYFAVGDFDNAIRVQKRALELEPHSPPLKRQLLEFQKAKEKADAAAEDTKAN